MKKRIKIGAKPTPAIDADGWVNERKTTEPIKRLTLNIPASLHHRIKADCASRGIKMSDEIGEILLKKYGNV